MTSPLAVSPLERSTAPSPMHGGETCATTPGWASPRMPAIGQWPATTPSCPSIRRAAGDAARNNRLAVQLRLETTVAPAPLRRPGSIKAHRNGALDPLVRVPDRETMDSGTRREEMGEAANRGIWTSGLRVTRPTVARTGVPGTTVAPPAARRVSTRVHLHWPERLATQVFAAGQGVEPRM
jgi:hypothetical protein